MILKIKEENYDDIIVDLTNINQIELLEFSKNKEFNLYLICDENIKIDKNLRDMSKKIIEKSLNKEFFQSF